ncbi:MAG: FHA domain-containing protein [Acidobacteriota bacterium]
MSGKASRTGAFLAALTAESTEAIQAREMNIPFLPFRIGRESRRSDWVGTSLADERRRSSPANNDLYLPDRADPMTVSREHCLIDRDDAGFFLADRGSRYGTIVEGETVGGPSAIRRITLSDHAVLIVGASISPFIFKFRIESPPTR